MGGDNYFCEKIFIELKEQIQCSDVGTWKTIADLSVD